MLLFPYREQPETHPHARDWPFATDSVDLLFDPSYVVTKSLEDIEFIVIHECEHVALLHSFRRGHRDPRIWNIACDHIINLGLKRAGYRMPADGLADARFNGLCEQRLRRPAA